MKSKILLGLMLITSTTLTAAPQYTITPLGTLGGDSSIANDINDSGQIVGSSLTSNSSKHAFISSIINGNRVMTDLTDLAANFSTDNISVANAINNNEQIVGSFHTATNLKSHAFIFEKSGDAWVTFDLNGNDGLTSTAYDINDLGKVTGFESNATSLKNKLFVASKTVDTWSVTNLAVIPGIDDIASSYGSAINDSGQIALNTFVSNDQTGDDVGAAHSLVQVGDSWRTTNIGEYREQNLTRINGMNNSSQMIGFSSEPVLRGASNYPILATKTEGGWIISGLGMIEGEEIEGEGIDINDAGIAVGYIDDPSGFKAFVYTNGKTHTLLNLVNNLEGWTSLDKAQGINNTGQIVGVGKYNGKKMAFLLTPTLERPASPASPEIITGSSCDLGLDPKTIKKGEGTALWWWSNDTSNASINNGIGNVELPSSHKWVYPTKTSTFKMTAKGKDGVTTSCEAEIIVEGILDEAPICEIGADPQTIQAGEGAALWWWSDIVASANINNGIGSIDVPSNFKWIYPKTTTTYKMIGKSASGIETTCETTIIVQ